jgi:hypothetical protein
MHWKKVATFLFLSCCLLCRIAADSQPYIPSSIKRSIAQKGSVPIIGGHESIIKAGAQKKDCLAAVQSFHDGVRA